MPATTKEVKAEWGESHRSLALYEPEGDLMVLNFGPQHPSTHGVFRIQVHLDGEVIIKATPDLGYLHRGVEKLCEVLTYVQVTPIVDKNDYVSPMHNEQAINMAYEKLLNVEVPRRARYLRTVTSEMQRLASHLLWLGTFCLDMGGALGGGSTVFMHTFRERDSILDLFEELTGARFHYNTHTIGGNRHDVTPGWAAHVKETINQIDARMPEYEGMSIGHRIFADRCKDIGVLDAELALQLGITGPILRASGVDHDLRRDAPYHAYDEIEVKVAVRSGGDCLARAEVRIDEMRESIRLVRALIDNIPEGPLCGYKAIKLPGQVKVAAGQVYAALESSRGELGTYVIAGGGEGNACPYRVKIRAPSFHALSTLPFLLPGHTLSDAVVILGSLDPIMGEVDR